MLMTAALNDYRLNVADLLRRPGATRDVDLRLAAPDDYGLALTSVDGPLHLQGVVESVVDGLLVRGVLEAGLGLSCARCLQPVRHAARTDVVELFIDPHELASGDEVEAGYEIAEAHLHLEALVRDALAVMTPLRPLCRADCRGLCPQCGTDRNEGACACADAPADPRWEALRGLRLPDGRS